MWLDMVDDCRETIRQRISQAPSPLELEIDPTLEPEEVLEISRETFRVFGFLDCTDFRTTRTGSGPTPDGSRRANAFDIQREFYSRYFRAHGLKYLSILLPNGMTAAVFGATLSTADNGLINMAGLNEYLLSLLQVLPTGFYPTVYGDAIMQLTPVIQSYVRNPTERQHIWNRRMASCRMSIELDYGSLFNLFRIMISGEELLHLYTNGEQVFQLGIVCFFLKNCYVCFNGSTTTSMFGTTAPNIDEYIPLDEDIDPYVPVPLDGVYNYGH